MLNPCGGEIHCLGEEAAPKTSDLLSQRCCSLGR